MRHNTLPTPFFLLRQQSIRSRHRNVCRTFGSDDDSTKVTSLVTGRLGRCGTSFESHALLAPVN